jgi:ATP-dependent Clp protease adapter protein ClpS
MFRAIREKWKSYCARNELAHAATRAQWEAQSLQYKNTITPLSDDLEEELARELEGDLFVLEIQDDDITPLTYVLEIVKQFSNREHSNARELTYRVHGKGSGQLIAGNKSALEKLAIHIEQDARARKFPLTCTVRKV